MAVTCTQLDVLKIRIDGGTQIRAELNQSRVEELSELLKEGHIFKDSIVVFYDGTEYWLGDGFHRVEATKLAGLATIDADVRSGTREEAIEHACGANATHGLPRNNKDKRNAVLRLLDLSKWQQNKSNVEIAKQCGVTEHLVRVIRSELPEEHPSSTKSRKPTNPPVEPSEGVEEPRNLRVTNKDKQVSLEDFFRETPKEDLDKLSNVEIANKCGVSEGTVRNYKKVIQDAENEKQRKVINEFFADFPGSEELSDKEIAKRCEVDEKLVKVAKKELAEEKQRLEQEEAARNASVPIPAPEPEPQPLAIPEPEITSEVEPEQPQSDKQTQEVDKPELEPEMASEPEQEPELPQSDDIEDVSELEPIPDPAIEETPEPEPVPINISGIIVPSQETLIEREIKRQQTQERNDQLREKGADLPQGRYACLVVDPPWPMKKIERDVRPNQIDFDYPTMTEEELKAFPLPDMAGDDCHLYLWTTQKYLPMALRLAEHWGFKYQCLMTWVKNVGPTPFSWMYTTEHVLFCSKGNLPLLTIGRRLDFVAKGREHSRKPDVFYELVREVSPGPRIDVFSREKREGFEQYGYEVEKYVSA